MNNLVSYMWSHVISWAPKKGGGISSAKKFCDMFAHIFAMPGPISMVDTSFQSKFTTLSQLQISKPLDNKS